MPFFFATAPDAADHGERSEGRYSPVGVGVGAGVWPAWRRGEVLKPQRPDASASDTPSSHSTEGYGEVRPPPWGLVETEPWPGAGRTGAPGLLPSARRKGDWDVPFRILSTATLRINWGVIDHDANFPKIRSYQVNYGTWNSFQPW